MQLDCTTHYIWKVAHLTLPINCMIICSDLFLLAKCILKSDMKCDMQTTGERLNAPSLTLSLPFALGGIPDTILKAIPSFYSFK